MTVCEWCKGHDGPAPVVKKMPDGLAVCKRCAKSVERFYSCSVCEKSLAPTLAGYYRSRFENPAFIVCGNKECRFKAAVKRGEYCCVKAKPIGCACFRAYKCPVHYPQGVHIGTHD